jgi:hypothetical protein
MRKFKFTITKEIILTEKEIWPNGDGPELPGIWEVEDEVEKQDGKIEALIDLGFDQNDVWKADIEEIKR